MNISPLLHLSLRLLLLGSLTLLWNCGGDKQKGRELNTDQLQKHALINEGTSLSLPTSFFRLTQEEFLSGKGAEIYDQVFVEQFTDLLTAMSFEDAQLDLFVDTSNYEGLLLFVDTEYIDLNPSVGNALASQVKQQNDAQQAANPNLEITSMRTSLDSGSGKSIMRLKYKFSDAAYGLTNYRSIYFVSTLRKTFVVHEFSATPRDVYDFLWSLQHDS